MQDDNVLCVNFPILPFCMDRTFSWSCRWENLAFFQGLAYNKKVGPIGLQMRNSERQGKHMTWEKFKKMTIRQKIDHIWEYYRWPILAVVVVLSFVISWIHGIVTRVEPLLDVVMIDANVRTPDGEVFQPFLEQAGYEYYDGAVIVNKNAQLNRPDGTLNLGGGQMLMCTIAAGEPDLFFWDTREVLPLLKDGVLRDLREILSPELLEQYEDSLVYAENPDTGESYPCGIYLEENPWITEQRYYESCTVSVATSAKDEKLAGAVLSAILTQ